MLKKTITYENPFTNQQVSEEHYFHISKADLVEMEMEEHDAKYEKDGQTLTGMQAKLQRIVDSRDGRAIMAEFKDIIRRSYGKKEGERFLKSSAIWEDFSASEAFSQLLFELCTDPEKAAEFVNGIVPGDLEKVIAEAKKQAEAAQGDPTGLTLPTPGPRPAAADTPAPKAGPISVRDEIKTATPENPVELTHVEMMEMNDHDLKAGLSDGRYRVVRPGTAQ